MTTRTLIWTLVLLLCGAAHAQTKQRIDKAADLPRFTYPVKGNLESLVRDEAAFSGFAAKLRSDVESVLGQYEIADKSMQRQLLGTLLQLDVLEQKDDAALARIEAVRALEEKPADKLLTGLQVRAMIEARKAVGNANSDAYRADVAQRMSQALKGMPYAVVSNDKGRPRRGRNEWARPCCWATCATCCSRWSTNPAR